jgi:PAS domain S-box-containing protein
MTPGMQGPRSLPSAHPVQDNPSWQGAPLGPLRPVHPECAEMERDAPPNAGSSHARQPVGSDPASGDARLLRLLFEQSSDVIVLCDMEARILLASPSARTLFAREPRELRGSTLPDFVHPDDALMVRLAIEGLAAGRSQLITCRIRRGDGADLEVETSLQPISMEQGRRGFLAIVRDVHARSARWKETVARGSSSGDGYLELGLDGRITLVTHRLLELWKLSAEEMARVESASPAERDGVLLGLTTARVIDHASYMAGLASQRQLPDEVTYEDIPLLDGRTLERYGAPRRGPRGELIGRALFLRDVTDVRCKEAELHERAQQQATIAEIGELALTGQDPDALLALSTRHVAATLGVDLVHVLELSPGGDHFLVRAANEEHPSFSSAPIELRDRSLASFTLLNHAPVVCPDLTTDPRFKSPRLRAAGISSSLSVIMRGRDRPFGLLAAHSRRRRLFTTAEVHFLETVANVLATMLARRATEAALQDRERQLRAVFENALDAVVTVDDEARFVDVNPAACQLFGRARGELCGRPMRDLLTDAEEAEATGTSLPGSARERGVAEVQGAAGGPRQVEYSTVRDILPGLHLTVLRDVTEQRQLQARLAIADRMASVGTLAAGVAHELNNPLSYVAANLAWSIETLRERPASLAEAARRSTELTEALAEARSGTDRMRDIIRDLRTFSRADTSRVGAVEIGAVLESCLNMTWNEIRHRAELVRDLGHVPAVHGNEARLGQVFVNLLVNAAQALPEGAADRNRIRVASRELEDGRVAVEIEDTGCGIPPRIRPRIFDPFFTTKPPGVGTGLGLSICHNIVTSLGGAIEVESEVGRGSTFRVFLQRWRGQSDTPAPLHAQASARHRAGRILVVDDEAYVGSAVRRALSGEHDVTVVASAREALALVGRVPPFDLVITDLLMPDMSGIDLAAELERRSPAMANRMIFMTGGAFTPASRAFVSTHRASCLEKPFPLDALRELVARRLSA